MNRLVIIALLSLIHMIGYAKSSNFVACKSTYALCTEALCEPLPGKAGFATCSCKVKTGYSAGTKPCTGVIKTQHGQAVSSRYYPIKSYKVCTNDRPWAFCLDSPCIMDPQDPSKATCICSLAKNQGKYIIVPKGHEAASCTQGIYSSATVDDVTQITDFLKTQPNLHPFPIKVLND
ncbi:hypothetical protein [Legionella fallonii]|uniref:Uncharacterized protein n=1 Tax=Legionella fallonii LLAP-10 TaxID=1212491 RepID=A0A098G7G0_9GAMM|nr:hypothetical protein [Legionella fallonii]CEG57941.1 conserved exported protein of unknown function [Legionella fallonii LLAP-10]